MIPSAVSTATRLSIGNKVQCDSVLANIDSHPHTSNIYLLGGNTNEKSWIEGVTTAFQAIHGYTNCANFDNGIAFMAKYTGQTLNWVKFMN